MCIMGTETDRCDVARYGLHFGRLLRRASGSSRSYNIKTGGQDSFCVCYILVSSG